MKYAAPGTQGSLVQFKDEYGNYIGGKWVGPVDGHFFDAICPVTRKSYTKVPRSNAKDIELAFDAAPEAAAAWDRTSATERTNLLLKIANRLEQNLEKFAVTETWGNGKPIRETLAADLPLCVNHYRYFPGVIRADEGRMAELDA